VAGKKCGGIAELDEEYIAKMEDVLKTYEKRYELGGTRVCFDERPVSLHADVRPPRPPLPVESPNKTTNMSVGEPPMFSAPWNEGRPALHLATQTAAPPSLRG